MLHLLIKLFNVFKYAQLMAPGIKIPGHCYCFLSYYPCICPYPQRNPKWGLTLGIAVLRSIWPKMDMIDLPQTIIPRRLSPRGDL